MLRNSIHEFQDKVRNLSNEQFESECWMRKGK